MTRTNEELVKYIKDRIMIEVNAQMDYLLVNEDESKDCWSEIAGIFNSLKHEIIEEREV